MQEPAFGIDFGDVIAGSRVPTDPRGIEIETDYLAVNRFLRVLPVEDAFSSIRELGREYFGERIWVISKWRMSVREKCTIWLRVHRFHELAGIPPERVEFCESRPEKAMRARELGLTHFVDNKLEVLLPMVGSVPNLFLFKPSELELAEYSTIPPDIRRVEHWREIVRAILGPRVS